MAHAVGWQTGEAVRSHAWCSGERRGTCNYRCHVTTNLPLLSRHKYVRRPQPVRPVTRHYGNKPAVPLPAIPFAAHPPSRIRPCPCAA